MNNATPLTAKEKARFEICKNQIRDGLQTCFDTGAALIEIKKSKLYREEFDTFEEFCQQSYQIGKSYAYRLIESAEIKTSPIGDKIQNEAQARAIAQVPEEDRKAVLKIAEKSGDVTAAAIAVAAEQVVGKITVHAAAEKLAEKKAKSEPVLDDTGTPIPADAIPFWRRRQEVQDVLNDLSRIKCLVEKAKKDGDCMFGKVSNATIDSLTSAYSHLLEAKPYAVCTSCMGRFSVQPKGCSMCGNKGLISKFQWDTQSRKEIKDMRLSIAAKQKASA